MTPRLIQLLMVFITLIGFKSLREVIRKRDNILVELLIFACAIIILIEYMMVMPSLG